MIRFILLQNRQGRTRLFRWYAPYAERERRRLVAEVHAAVAQRDRRRCQFVEHRDLRLIYRQYAGLYFVLGVDEAESEFAVYELIHLFVELLDVYFGNVCELDIVFNFDKVYALLDFVILGGEIANTNRVELLAQIKAADAVLGGKVDAAAAAAAAGGIAPAAAGATAAMPPAAAAAATIVR